MRLKRDRMAYRAGILAGCLFLLLLSGCGRPAPDPVAAARAFFKQHFYFDTLEDVGSVREAVTPGLYGLLNRLNTEGLAMGYVPEVCSWTDGQDGWFKGEPVFTTIQNDGQTATVRMDYEFELGEIERKSATLTLEWDAADRRWRVADLVGPEGESYVESHEKWFRWMAAEKAGTAPPGGIWYFERE